MSTKQKTNLVPKLRFPEFRGAEGWTYGQLDSALLSISNGIALEQSGEATGYKVTRIETISAGTIDLEKVGLVKTSQDISAYKLNIGDILLSNINSVAHIGKSVFIDRDYDLYHGMNLLRLGVNRAKNEPKFIFYAINTDGIRASLRERANKAVNQASINQTELGKTNVALPEITEQQKIADCLSSLDELIAAQARKVEALKTHKKGLMQQLFPREGETQPRLRFPEFETTSAWEVKKLEELAKRGSGHTPSKNNPEYYGGEIKWISLADSKRLDAGFISETETEISALGIKKSSAVLHPAGTVLISRDAGVGKSAVMAEPMAVSQHFIVWTCHADLLSNWFLYYLLQDMKPIFERIATGSTIKTIGLPFFKELRISVPTLLEQQRIAHCICSLDDLITAAIQDLDILKTHKKGLMQQLFPSGDEVEA